MDAKILLFDANDIKIGETFIRRARQLVKQQRAEWMDENKKAIRFVTDVEDWENPTNMGDDESPITAPTGFDPQVDERLIALAEKRVNERSRFTIHSIAFIPGWFFLFILALVVSYTWDGQMAAVLLAFISGSWLTAYVMHLCYYLVSRRSKYRSTNREERKARRLAAEIALLKSELRG